MELFVQNTKTSSDTTTATALWYQSKERSEQKQRLDKRVGFSAEGGLDLIANRQGAIIQIELPILYPLLLLLLCT